MFTFDQSKILGKGGFGVVFQGTWQKENEVKIEVAVKRVQLAQLQINDQHEENNLRKLNHPNVVKLFDVSDDADFRYLILELCDASLDQVFLDPDNPKKYQGPNLPHYLIVLFQLAIGIEYIHSNNLIHRNVKPENVLISVDSTNETVTLKWAGFGLSRPVGKSGTYEMSEIVGTETWMTPDLLKQLDKWARKDSGWNQTMLRGTIKNDVFPLGLLFACYLNGVKHPYGSSRSEITINIRMNNPTELILPKEYSYLRNIILNMLKPEEERSTSSEVLHQLKNVLTKDGSNALSVVCKEIQSNNLIPIIKYLCAVGIDVNCKNKDGWNALLFLCRHYQKENLIDIVRLLIEKGIYVNCRDKNGWNALLALFRYYQKENLIGIVRILVEKGIYVNCKDNDGWNALLFLCRYYQKENLIGIVRILVEKGIDVNCKNKDGWNALLLLCRHYQKENLIDIVRLLVEKGIDIHCKDEDGKNALLFLCFYYRKDNLIDIVRLLVEKGINVNYKDEDRWNAINRLNRFYRNNNLSEIIGLIEDQVFYVNERNDNELTYRDSTVNCGENRFFTVPIKKFSFQIQGCHSKETSIHKLRESINRIQAVQGVFSCEAQSGRASQSGHRASVSAGYPTYVETYVYHPSSVQYLAHNCCFFCEKPALVQAIKCGHRNNLVCYDCFQNHHFRCLECQTWHNGFPTHPPSSQNLNQNIPQLNHQLNQLQESDQTQLPAPNPESYPWTFYSTQSSDFIQNNGTTNHWLCLLCNCQSSSMKIKCQHETNFLCYNCFQEFIFKCARHNCSAWHNRPTNLSSSDVLNQNHIFKCRYCFPSHNRPAESPANQNPSQNTFLQDSGHSNQQQQLWSITSSASFYQQGASASYTEPCIFSNSGQNNHSSTNQQFFSLLSSSDNSGLDHQPQQNLVPQNQGTYQLSEQSQAVIQYGAATFNTEPTNSNSSSNAISQNIASNWINPDEIKKEENGNKKGDGPILKYKDVQTKKVQRYSRQRTRKGKTYTTWQCTKNSNDKRSKCPATIIEKIVQGDSRYRVGNAKHVHFSKNSSQLQEMDSNGSYES